MLRSKFVPVDFAAVSRAALGRLPDILARWLPGGRIEGREYIVRNPEAPRSAARQLQDQHRYRAMGRFRDRRQGRRSDQPRRLSGGL